jgi:hypothetical protein
MVTKSLHGFCISEADAHGYFYYTLVCDLRCGRRMRSAIDREKSAHSHHIRYCSSGGGGGEEADSQPPGRKDDPGEWMRLKCPAAPALLHKTRAQPSVNPLCLCAPALALSYCLVFDLWSCSSEPRALTSP